jgi:alpha-beta hydrolase superfamily lysophospholipase
VLVHGYAEHSGRYEHTGASLANAGYAVHAFDLRGHGQSGGERRWWGRSALPRDLRRFVQRGCVRSRGAALPLRSMAHDRRFELAVAQPLVRGGWRGAGLSLDAAPWIARQAFLLLGRLAPRLGTLRLNAASVSRDEAVVRLYDGDPLVYRGRMRAGLVAAMVRALQRVARDMEQVRAPLLIMHGTADALSKPEGSAELHRRASSTDKALKLYDGLFHEILNEPERDEVLADMVAWLDARSGAG